MAGHSKWANIKHKKARQDIKRGKIFSRLVKEITMSLREGGEDTKSNYRLKLAIAKAKEANVPSKNIENAIKRGNGKLKGGDIVNVVYEGYGPGGIAIVVECLTDNKNRTFTEVRTVFSKNHGNLGSSGSVGWQFEKKGIIHIEKSDIFKEEILLEKAIEAGAEDMMSEEGLCSVITPMNGFHEVLERLKQDFDIFEAEINYIPSSYVDISSEEAQRVQTLLDKLLELDDVDILASNERVLL